jgi:hypothetical protein
MFHSRKNRWLPSAILFGSLALAPGLKAQELTGRIHASTDSTPVVGALVILVDSIGREVGRTMSSPSGGFGLKADAPGIYHVRVIRIGFASWLSPPLVLRANERRDHRFTIEDRIVRLPDIQVATASRCGVRPGDGHVIASLLTEVEKALALTNQTIRLGNLRFRTETYVSRPTADGAPGEKQTSTSVGQAVWPVRSAPPESLAVWGFVHEPDRGAQLSELQLETGPIYFGPDARVLFAGWFLDSHCFSVLRTPGDSTRSVIVEFVPAGRQKRPDIRGRLTLDRGSLELRSLEFWYTGLPRWAPADSSGGSMSFRRMASGAWIIDRWRIRAPIPMVGIRVRDTTLYGFAESGGRVVEIRDGRNGTVERVSWSRPKANHEAMKGWMAARSELLVREKMYASSMGGVERIDSPPDPRGRTGSGPDPGSG